MISSQLVGLFHGDNDARVVRLEIDLCAKFSYREWGEPAMPIGIDVDHDFKKPQGRLGSRTKMVRHDSPEDRSTAGIEDIVDELGG